MTEIQIRRTCASCEGNGYTENPLWKQCNEALKDEPQDEYWLDKAEDWFRERNYNFRREAEEEICRSCKGEGKETLWISLEELHKLMREEGLI